MISILQQNREIIKIIIIIIIIVIIIIIIIVIIIIIIIIMAYEHGMRRKNRVTDISMALDFFPNELQASG